MLHATFYLSRTQNAEDSNVSSSSPSMESQKEMQLGYYL